MSKSICPKCGKHSIVFDITPKCRSCGLKMSWTEFYLVNPQTATKDLKDEEQLKLEMFG